jgi:hypothetical protein
MSFFSLVWTGNYTFKAAQLLGVPQVWAMASAVGDFNGDGVLDIVIAPSEQVPNGEIRTTPTPGRLLLLQGNGDGSFIDASATLPGAGIYNAMVRKIKVGDFNNDGKDDFLPASNYEDGRDTSAFEYVWANQFAFLSSHSGFNALNLDVTTWGHDVVSGDFNGDGLTDFMVGGFHHPDNQPAHTALFLQTAVSGAFDKVWLPNIGGLSSIFIDVDGDGQKEVVEYAADWSDGLISQGFAIHFFDSNYTVETKYFPEPFLRKEPGVNWTGNSTTFLIYVDDQGREYVDGGVHDMVARDMNQDGKQDIVALRFGFYLDYVNGVLTEGGKPKNFIEIYTPSSNGVTKLPVIFDGWDDSFMPFYFHLLDWNNDGHIDIFMESADKPVLFLNDGNLHFKLAPEGIFPPSFNSDFFPPVSGLTAIPLDANDDGIVDLLYRARGFWDMAIPELSSAPSEYLFLGTQPFHTGPMFIDPALQGAPGFNEAYYLNTYPAIKALVETGVVASGLDHYLQYGRAEGLHAFAPHTWVHGSAQSDVIQLREGNEKAFGGDGNDTIIGMAGDDWIDGGPGFDTAVMNDNFFNSNWKLVNGNLVINSADGSDTLISIERIQFNDWVADGSLKDSAAAILQIWQFLSGNTPDEASFNSAFRLLAGMNGMMGTANGWNGYATSLADSNFAPEFTAKYKSLDTNSFINAVTTEVFGHAVNTEAVRNSFEIYKDYFASQFSATDPTGTDRAMGYFIGDMLHQASDINFGKYNAAAEVFLVGLANGSGNYGQDLFFS